MRVCDRHPRKKAIEEVHIKSTDTWYDLCQPCVDEITKFISKPRQDAVDDKRTIFGRKKSA